VQYYTLFFNFQQKSKKKWVRSKYFYSESPPIHFFGITLLQIRRSSVVFFCKFVPPLVPGGITFFNLLKTQPVLPLNFNFLSEKMSHFCNQKTIFDHQMLGLKWGFELKYIEIIHFYQG
jgi:hypothetical protein